MRGSRRWVPAIIVGFVVATVVLNPGRANAHPYLVRTTPQAGERLVASPPMLTLQFSEQIAGGEQVTLKTSDGRAVPIAPVERLPDGRQIETRLPPLEAAVYIVSWQVLGADGDLDSGEFAFAVGSGDQLPTVSSVTGAISWGNTLASWLFLTGLVLAVGGLASERFIWRPVAQRYALTVPQAPVLAGLLLALAGATLVFVLLAGARTGRGVVAGLDPGGWPATFGTRPGRFAAAVVFFVAYALWLVLRQRLRVLALAPLLGAIIAAAWRGHSGVSTVAGRWWAAPANALHLAGAALWLGALVHLALNAWRLRAEKQTPILAEAAHRYARFALPTVLLMVLAGGAITALAEFTRPSELMDTTYGRMLVLKLAFVVVALLLALSARFRALMAGVGVHLARLRRLTMMEAMALLGVTSVTAVLMNATPPRSATATQQLLGPPPLEGSVVRMAAMTGLLTVFVGADEDQLQVRVVPPQIDPLPEVRTTVQARHADGTEVTFTPQACGPGCLMMPASWPTGTTTLRVTTSAEQLGGGDVEFSLVWPPQPEDPALLERVITTMRAQPRFTMTERVSSGPGMATTTGVKTGEQFMAQEPYAAGGASDIRPLPAPPGVQRLSLSIPASSLWFALEIDDQGRLQRQTMVNPGHVIERTFTYDLPATP